jgi:hypothetical protein
MSLHQANDTRLTRTAFDALTTAYVDPDPKFVVNQDIFGHGKSDGETGKSRRSRVFRAGQVVRKSQIDRAFRLPTINAVSPATGPAAGGTAVTLTGSDFDDNPVVKFDTTNATAVVVVSSKKITCVAPAHAAATVNVSVQQDGGTTTKTGAYVYT